MSNAQAQKVPSLIGPKPLGRSIFADDREAVIEEICQRLMLGEPLASICRDPNMPAADTIHDWGQREPSLARRIALCREMGSDAIAVDALNIADNVEGYGSGDTSRDKLRVDTRLKLLGKWSPGRYGDSVQLKHADANGDKLDTSQLVDQLLAELRGGPVIEG